jgi:membrane protein DedA with SNARE-associated domain
MIPPDLLTTLNDVVQQYGLYAIFGFYLLEGSATALTAGFLAGIGTLVFWQVLLLSMAADFIISHFYYGIGRESYSLFRRWRSKYTQANDTKPTLHRWYERIRSGYKNHFVLTYLIARFVPLPYTTSIAHVASGNVIKYQRFLKLLLWSMPLQSLLYVSLGYLIAQGLVYELTGLRLLGLIVVGLILILLFWSRKYLRQYFDKEIDST